jgi:hypothetical protein
MYNSIALLLKAGVAFRPARRPIRPIPAKQIQAKALGFAWFYSSDSGLFNGLRRKKQKKSSLSFLSVPRRIARREFDPRADKGIAQPSDFRKGIARLLV